MTMLGYDRGPVKSLRDHGAVESTFIIIGDDNCFGQLKARPLDKNSGRPAGESAGLS